MAQPSMVVRVSGNIEDLRKALQDGERTIETTTGKVLQFRRETERAAPVGKQVSAAYREFDGVLQSLGINIGPYVKGLEDITTLATKGASGLGLLSGAAAVVGTAIASWKIGEQIGLWTGWTNEIARGTAVLKGYGDVAQEEMLARMQSIELHGHAEAMWKKQAESVAETTEAAKQHTDELQRQGMVTAGNAAHMTALASQLEALKEKRLADSRAAFAASQAQSIFKEETKETTVVIEQQTRALDEHLQKIAQEAAARKKAIDDLMHAPTLNQRVNPTMSMDLKALTQSDLRALNIKYDPFMKGGDTGVWKRLADLEASEGTYAPKSHAQYSRMLRETLELAQLRMWAEGKQRPPGLAGGATNWPGGWAMVGERGPEMVRLPSGSDVVPHHRIGATVNVAVHVQGSVLSTAEQLIDVIGNGLMRRLAASGFLNPPPA